MNIPSNHQNTDFEVSSKEADLDVSAKDHEEYQHWYESESDREAKTFNARIIQILDKKESPVFSWVVLILITIIASIAGFVAIRLLPEYQNKYSVNVSKMSRFRQIPKDKVGYESVLTFPVEFETLTCLCSDSQDQLFVGGDKNVTIYSKEGKPQFSLALSDTPTSISVSENNCVFPNCLIVSFSNRLEVYKLELFRTESYSSHPFSREPFFTWESGSDKSYLRKVVSMKDSLFVCDAGEKLVYKIDKEGRKILTIGQLIGSESSGISESSGMSKISEISEMSKISESGQDEFPGFSIPTLPFLDAVFSSDKNILWITNPGKHKIEAFTPDGKWKPELAWGTNSAYYEGFCGCCNPTGLAILDKNYFVTAEKFIRRVKIYQVYDTFYDILSVVATPDELDNPPKNLIASEEDRLRINYKPNVGEEYPVQITVLLDKRIAVLDPTYAVVRIYSPK